ENSNSSVRATDIKGSASVRSTFGAVVLDGIQGKIDVDDQNGAVDVKSAAAGGCQDVTAKTSFAPIRVAIPDGAGYTVTARTSFGKVRTELPITSTGRAPHHCDGRFSGRGHQGKDRARPLPPLPDQQQRKHRPAQDQAVGEGLPPSRTWSSLSLSLLRAAELETDVDPASNEHDGGEED